MTFKWLNKLGVESTEGFIVQRTGRFTAEYQEGERVITVNVEPGVLPGRRVCLLVSASEFEKWNDGTPISKERQKQILDNFIAANEFQDMPIVID